jgi:hypothetical protein
MRALGPGSVSSFLKVILDVFHFVLWLVLGAAAIALIAVLLLSFRPDLLGDVWNDRLHVEGPWLGPVAAAAILVGALYIAGSIIIVGRLRRIFRTLIAGDPFHPENVRRLRVIALTLAVLELGRYATAALAHILARLLHTQRIQFDGGINLTTWFAVLVIVVLAEVFKEGARLRGEAELTI